MGLQAAHAEPVLCAFTARFALVGDRPRHPTQDGERPQSQAHGHGCSLSKATPPSAMNQRQTPMQGFAKLALYPWRKLMEGAISWKPR
jgi:hypothetical protein